MNRYLKAAGAIAICLGLGCTAHEGADVSDTATNWLGDCRSSAECSGGASCIEEKCVFACGIAETRACESIDPDARCVLASAAFARCDLPCANDAECGLAAGDEQQCRQGYCWPGIMIPSASTTARESQGIRPELADQGPVEPSSLIERERVAMSFEPTQVMTIADPSRQGSPPHVAWLDSRWQVSWSSPELALDDSPVEPLLYLASVRPDGEVERRAASFSLRTFDDLHNGERGALALLRPAQLLGSQPQPCEIAVTDTLGWTSVPAFRFSCGGEFAAASIRDSEDWLVLFSPPAEGQRGAPSDELWLARYRPSARGWIAGPWQVTTGEPRGAVALGTLQEDAVLVWHTDSRTQLARLQGVAGATPVEPAGELSRLGAFDTPQEPPYAFTATSQGALLLWPDAEAGLSSASILASGGAVSQSSAAAPPVFGPAPGMAAIPERAQVAVCYTTRTRPGSGDGDTVSLVVIDEDGALVGAPTVVASASANVGGCDLAWSGSALLVAWCETDLDTPRTSPPISTVRARIFDLP